MNPLRNEGLPTPAAAPSGGGAPAERLETRRLLTTSGTVYRALLAAAPDQVRRAQALRYQVFNLELNEGLAESHETGLDEDAFDGICDHLLVEHVPSGTIVGTYRLQTGTAAAAGRGYYSALEFDFSPFEPLRRQLIELGRACVHQQHRNLHVLGLLWKGIADYAAARGARYLCGCSSLTSQDPAVGADAYSQLCRRHLATPEFRTRPHPAFECPLDGVAPEPTPLPKLLRAYLNLGAVICGPPAIDREFKTIDFLTLLDLDRVSPSARERFMK